MGFEYKISATLTSEHQEEIKDILERHPLFDKKYLIGKVQYWDFRHCENKPEMPDFTIALEDNGLYICKYTKPNLWDDLKELQEYLASNNIDTLIHEE